MLCDFCGTGGVYVRGLRVINSLWLLTVRDLQNLTSKSCLMKKSMAGKQVRNTKSLQPLTLGNGVCIWNHSLVCCLKRLLGVKFCHMILASGYDWSQWGSSVCIWGHSMTLPACFHSLYFCVTAPLSRDNLNCSFTLDAICKESYSCVSFHSLSSP